jgi:hypothetical protein
MHFSFSIEAISTIFSRFVAEIETSEDLFDIIIAIISSESRDDTELSTVLIHECEEWESLVSSFALFSQPSFASPPPPFSSSASSSSLLLAQHSSLRRELSSLRSDLRTTAEECVALVCARLSIASPLPALEAAIASFRAVSPSPFDVAPFDSELDFALAGASAPRPVPTWPVFLWTPAAASLSSARFDAAADEHDLLLSEVALAAPAAGADIWAGASLAALLSDAEAVLALADADRDAPRAAVALHAPQFLSDGESLVSLPPVPVDAPPLAGPDDFYSDDGPILSLPRLSNDSLPRGCPDDFYSQDSSDPPERSAPLLPMRRDRKRS